MRTIFSSACLIILLFCSACSTIEPVGQSDREEKPFDTSTQTSSPKDSQSTSNKQTPSNSPVPPLITPPLIAPVDGPSILAIDDVSSIKYPAHERYFNPEGAILYNESSASDIEITITGLCDEYFETFCRSVSIKEEIDLAPFYDLTTDVRIKDWIFNQMWLYGEVEKNKKEVALEYLGSSYAFLWDYWNNESKTGIVSVFSKTGLIREYSNGERITLSNINEAFFTHEFAFTYVDGVFKLIRFRDLGENYRSLQLRVIDDPFCIEDIATGRKYIDDILMNR